MTAAPAEPEARRQAREERIARRQAWERENPPEVRRLAKRFEAAAGLPADAAAAMARHVTGHSGDAPAPDVTDALTAAAVHMLLNLARKHPPADAFLEPLRRRIVDSAGLVRNWDSLQDRLALLLPDIGPAFDEQVERIWQAPEARAVGVDETTVEAWRQAARMLALARLLDGLAKANPSLAQEAMGKVSIEGGRLRAMDLSEVRRKADPRGTLLVTVHNTHLGALTVACLAAFPDHHVVRADDMKNPRDAGKQLLPMIRALRRGGAGLLVPDGAFGRVDREVEVLGEPLPVSDAFARIAWMSGCRVVFGVGSSVGREQGLSFELTDLPRRTEDMPEVEAYVDSMLEAYAGAVRDAMVRCPFDTGLSHRLGKRAQPQAAAQGAGTAPAVSA
ncbi:hypothetical protein GI374_14300 [Paracoccus sp. S-4012]|uniref:hypothetical protein n=1 Tax=Paracoccus sp. S-4012 TaxID=2665648 RepID=UPI0012B1485F|nr:hypothetical protein [Paracoccus sp. S-4012]MRX51586.1 hypothetical protein [Paracoccus sp. S-4012]